MENCVHMKVKRAIPCFGRNLKQAAGNRTAGGMHQNVQATQSLGCLLHATRGIVRFGAVRNNHFAAPAQSRDRLADRFSIGIIISTSDGHVSAITRERNGSGSANPFGAAGNQSHFAFQFH